MLYLYDIVNISHTGSYFLYCMVYIMTSQKYIAYRAKISDIPRSMNHLMQPSMGTLNSPSSRVVKDSMPSRRRIFRCINFGIGETSPYLFFEHDESLPSKIWSTVYLERTGVLSCESNYIVVLKDLAVLCRTQWLTGYFASDHSFKLWWLVKIFQVTDVVKSVTHIIHNLHQCIHAYPKYSSW